MRKVLLLLIGIVVVFGCSTNDTMVPDNDDGTGGDGMNDQTDDDQGDVIEGEETLVFSLEIIGDHIPEGGQLDLYVANSENVIVGQVSALNDQKVDLYGILQENENYSVNLVTKGFPNPDSFLIRSFPRPEVGTYTIQAEDFESGWCSTTGQVNLRFENSGYPVEILIWPYPNPEVAGEEDGGYFELTPSIICDPGRVYIPFRPEPNGIPRYYYNDQLQPDQMVTIDSSTLPVLDNIVNLNFPDPLRDAYILAMANKDGQSFFLHELYWGDPIPYGKGDFNYDFNMYLANGFFDSVSVTALLLVGEHHYNMRQVGDPVTGDFTVPDIDYTVSNNSIDDFQMTTSGEYEYFSISARHIRVIGEASETVNISVGELVRNIFSIYPDQNSSDIPESIGLKPYFYKNSYLDNYRDIVQYRLDSKLVPRPEQYNTAVMYKSDY